MCSKLTIRFDYTLLLAAAILPNAEKRGFATNIALGTKIHTIILGMKVTLPTTKRHFIMQHIDSTLKVPKIWRPKFLTSNLRKDHVMCNSIDAATCRINVQCAVN